MSICPCGSHLDYADCCQPVHNSHKNAKRPEQLMRARFAAHKLNLVDFVISTYHTSCQAEEQRDGITESVALDWTKLEVLDAPATETDEGFVEFKAYLQEGMTEQCMHERSRFVRENNLWYYIDGVFPEPVEVIKVGRNDPCPCGSGKKFKKCCG